MKKITTLLLILITISPVHAFFWNKKEKPSLFLSSKDPRISTEYDNKLQNEDVFKLGDRIYFFIYTKEGFKSDYIKYQIVKQDGNAHVGGYTRIRNITKRVTNKNYYTDYFVLSETGKYILQIFDITNLHHWIAIGQFMVVNE